MRKGMSFNSSRAFRWVSYQFKEALWPLKAHKSSHKFSQDIIFSWILNENSKNNRIFVLFSVYKKIERGLVFFEIIKLSRTIWDNMEIIYRHFGDFYVYPTSHNDVARPNDYPQGSPKLLFFHGF